MKFIWMLSITAILFSVHSMHAKVTIPTLERVKKKVENALKDGTTKVFTKHLKSNVAYDVEHDIAQVHDLFKQLYWAYKRDFAMFLQKKDISDQEKRTYLTQAIIERHSGLRPIIDFSQALACEEQILAKIFTLVLSLAEQRKKTPLQDIDLKLIAEKHMQCSEVLLTVMHLCNALFMNP